MRKSSVSDQSFTLFSFFLDALGGLKRIALTFEGNLLVVSFERISQKLTEMRKLAHFSFDLSRNPLDLDYLSPFME